MSGTASAARLYTPQILALAVSLADFPFDPAMPLAAEARSRACGSVLSVSSILDRSGTIAQIGLQVRACAIGQAAAAIFAQAALGRSRAQIDAAIAGIEAWLAGTAARPPWPGLDMLDPAVPFPARHGAILLPWKAAQAALGKAETAS